MHLRRMAAVAFGALVLLPLAAAPSVTEYSSVHVCDGVGVLGCSSPPPRLDVVGLLQFDKSPQVARHILANSSEATLVGRSRRTRGRSVFGAEVDPRKEIDCCRYPELNTSTVLLKAHEFREALQSVVPGSWFLVEGSLIGALRYGAPLKKLRSGKLNLIDIDLDVAIVVADTSEETRVLQDLSKTLGSQWELVDKPRLEEEPVYFDLADREHKHATPKSPPDLPVRVDVHVLYEDNDINRTGKLRASKRDTAWLFRNGKHHTSSVSRDMIFPLRKAQWMDGIAYVPRQAIMIMQNDLEDGTTRGELWKPMQERLATAHLFDKECPCALDNADVGEIQEDIRELDSHGFASFAELLRSENTEDKSST